VFLSTIFNTGNKLGISAGGSGTGESLYPDISLFVPVTRHFTSVLFYFCTIQRCPVRSYRVKLHVKMASQLN